MYLIIHLGNSITKDSQKQWYIYWWSELSCLVKGGVYRVHTHTQVGCVQPTVHTQPISSAPLPWCFSRVNSDWCICESLWRQQGVQILYEPEVFRLGFAKIPQWMKSLVLIWSFSGNGFPFHASKSRCTETFQAQTKFEMKEYLKLPCHLTSYQCISFRWHWYELQAHSSVTNPQVSFCIPLLGKETGIFS